MDRKIVERLIKGESQNQIISDLHVGKRRVRKLREEAERAGYLSGQVPLPPFPQALFPDPVDRRTLKPADNDLILQPQVEWIKDRLLTGWQPVTVWEELETKVPRASFYRFLERHGIARLGESFRHIPEILHEPGEALLLDWGKLRDVIENGKKKILWAFVGVLGFSRYMMVRLVWSNDVVTTITSIESMLREIGGIPSRVTSDNPKCFALEASRYEPILNPVFERFASHYGFTMECLPPNDPEKKGKVERPMPYVRRLYQAHGDAWAGIEESQEYLNKKLKLANERKHGTTRQRPIDDFLNTEKMKLKELPPLAYEIEEFAEADVRRDGFVCFKGKYYAVDESLRGEAVAVVANASRVAIYHKGKLIETYERITSHHQSKSIKPHLQKSWEKNLKDHGHYLWKARAIGPEVEKMVQAILLQGEGFVDTRKVWGILSLDKSHSKEAVNKACRDALELGLVGYQAVKSLLTITKGKGGAQEPKTDQSKSESNKFVRPMSEYKKQLKLLH
jgi:transposase